MLESGRRASGAAFALVTCSATRCDGGEDVVVDLRSWTEAKVDALGCGI